MKINNQDVGVVILAAGRGTRLNCEEVPKVMLEIDGRPMVDYTVETLEKLGFNPASICMVVGFQKEKVENYFEDRAIFAHQEEQLGTAHAAFVGMNKLSDDIDHVVVLGGDDSAFYQVDSLKRFIRKHIEDEPVLTLLSTRFDKPDQYGRVVRHDNGDIEIIEKEYLTEEQKKIKEISTGTFCFDKKWFEEMFPNMPKLRKLNEYGLPTAMAMAREANEEYQVVELQDSDEWIGVNTPEDLREARKMMDQINL